MTRLVRDYIEVPETASLDALIAALTAARDSLPDGAEPQVRFRGDDHFGRHIAIAFKRPLTETETAAEARHSPTGLKVAA